MDNRKHRPPHAVFKIEECIKVGHYDEAQRYTDENVEFYDRKIEEQQDLFLKAQIGKLGLEDSRDTRYAVAAATPKRRISLMQRQAE